MENRILLPICFILLSTLLHGQDIQFKAWNGTGYDTAMDFPAEGVADDYGPRATSPEYFHLGMDYNSEYNDGNNDMWDLVLAPEDGTIVDVNRLWMSGVGNTYKQLCYEAGDHRYIFGHLYKNTPKDFVENDTTIILKNLLGENNDKWGQILIIGQDTFAYGQVIGSIEFNGDTIGVTNKIIEGDPICPIGTSSTAGAHLHLNTIPLNKDKSTGKTYYNSNPLQYINYKDTSYTITMYSKNNNQNNTKFAFDYPGDKTSGLASKVKLNTTIKANGKRYAHIFDVDKVRFYVKNNTIVGNDYNLIQGLFKESEIILGGILGEDLKNHPKQKFEIDWWKTTGVASHAYTGGTYNNHNWDIYHFSDWITRIHKDDKLNDGMKEYADFPENCRYNDGYYSLKVVTENIRQSKDSLTQDSILLDNFIPYIRHVDISFDGTDLGDLTRTADEKTLTTAGDGTLKSTISTETATVDATGDLKVVVIVSEPMTELHMNVPKLNMTNIAPTSQVGLEYTFELTNVTLFDDSETCLKLEFTGEDTNSNDILNVAKKTNGNDSNTEIKINKRQKTGTGADKWYPQLSDTGIDSLTICIGSCSGGGGFKGDGEVSQLSINTSDCLDLFLLEELVTNTICGDSSGTIAISHPDINSTHSVEWYDEKGSPLDDLDGQFEIYDLPAGTYCYILYNDDCCFKRCVHVGAELLTTDILLEVNEALGSTTSWAKITMNGMDAPYTVTWTDSQDSIIDMTTTNDYDISPFNLELGQNYCVNVVSASGCTYDDCFTITGTNCPSGYKVELVDIDSTLCGDNSGRIEIGIDTLLPSCFIEAGFDISWSSEEYGYSLENISAGEYCVTVTNLNENACIDCKTVACFEVFDNDEGCDECENPIVVDAWTGDICYTTIEHTDPKSGLTYYELVIGYGWIFVDASGGFGNLTISWSDGSNAGFKRKITSPGEYCATITDECGNSVTECWEIVIIYTDKYCLSPYFGEDGRAESMRMVLDSIENNWNSVQNQISVNDSIYVVNTSHNSSVIEYDIINSNHFNKIGEIEISRAGSLNQQVNQNENEVKDLQNLNENKENNNQLQIDIKCFPNPFNNELSVQLITEYQENGVLEIYDVLGNRLLSQHLQLLKGDNVIDLSKQAPLLSNGVLIITYKSLKGQIISTKVVKVADH